MNMETTTTVDVRMTNPNMVTHGPLIHQSERRILLNPTQFEPVNCLNIDNQRHGLETQAKVLMLLTPHPLYGLICLIVKPCDFAFNIFQDFVLTYFKHERLCQCT